MRRPANRLLLVLGLLSALLSGLTAGSATAVDFSAQRIVNYQTGGSLMPYSYGNNSRDGLHIVTFDPSGTRGGDHWTFESVGGGAKIIRNTKTGKCLKPGKPYAHKTRVEQWTCNYTPEFQWRVTSDGYGTYEISSVASRQVLAPYRGNRSYEVLVLEPDMNTAKQRWSITSLY